MPRVLEIDPARLDRWISGFADRHGATTEAVEPGPGVVRRLVAPDGAVAQVLPWAEGAPDLPTRLGLLLVRRGGYAVGRAEGGRLVDHYCGTRYVQSRTAKGGWSQQRFARRRGNQADALVARAVEQARDRLLSPTGPRVTAMVLGGDKALVRQLLEDADLAPLARLPRRTFHDLPDPRLTVLQEALRRGRATRIKLTQPEGT